MSEDTREDIADAPANGEVIELLIEGSWMHAYWTESANDMSPFGISGWASYEDNMYIPEDIIESWRYSDSIDDYHDDQAINDARLAEEQERLDGIRKDRNRAAREKTLQNRKDWEQRYKEVVGTDIEGQKMKIADIRKAVNAKLAERSLRLASELFASILSKL